MVIPPSWSPSPRWACVPLSSETWPAISAASLTSRTASTPSPLWPSELAYLVRLLAFRFGSTLLFVLFVCFFTFAISYFLNHTHTRITHCIVTSTVRDIINLFSTAVDHYWLDMCVMLIRFWHVLAIFNGYPTFVISIAAVGLCTAVIGDVAGHLGCFIYLKDCVNAIAFVALGTSVPGL